MSLDDKDWGLYFKYRFFTEQDSLFVTKSSDFNGIANYLGDLSCYKTVKIDDYFLDNKLNKNFTDHLGRYAISCNLGQNSAKDLFKNNKPYYLVAFILLLAFALIISDLFMSLMFIAINIVYFAIIIFKIYLFYKSYKTKEHNIINYDQKDLTNFPVYTILVPLYKEKPNIVIQIIGAIENLVYPKDKLDVKLLIEQDDLVLIDFIANHNIPDYFSPIIIPNSLPKTKAKACNYALPFAYGKYLVIYDAEDLPEPNQLTNILKEFDYYKGNDKVICIQSRLNYYNKNHNILTNLFALEYKIWFDYMIKTLADKDYPITLGGTSNHFILDKLRLIGAWDCYNVTEDAELGIRIANQGYQIKLSNTLTLEESPISLKNWINQRTRWLKGYLQTYFIYLAHPLDLLKNLGIKKFISFNLLMGVAFFMLTTIPFSLLFLVSYNGSDKMFFNYISYFNLSFAILTIITISFMTMIREKRQRYGKIAFFTLISPLYFAMQIFVVYRSLYSLIKKPFYWHKTEHLGITPSDKNLL